MPVLPPSALRGLSDKQVAALRGLSAKKITALKKLPAQKIAALRGLSASQIASLGIKAKVKRKIVPGAFRLHQPRPLPDSVSVSTDGSLIILKVGGVPENWSNTRYGKAVYQKSRSDPWRKLVRSLADQARAQAHRERQVTKHPKRRVEIMIFRCAPMFDPDAISHTMKPVIDALKQILLYDDNPTYLDLDVEQTRITSKKDQHIEITIRGLDLV